MLPFIDIESFKQKQYDLIYLGEPYVDMDSVGFSDFSVKDAKDFEVAFEQPSQSEVFISMKSISPDPVFAVSLTQSTAYVGDKAVVVQPNDMIIFYPGTPFSFSSSSAISAKSIPMLREPTINEASFFGTNCRMHCNRESILFDSKHNKVLAIYKLYELKALTPIIPVLNHQLYSPSARLVFPDFKTSRFAFSYLKKLNQSYAKRMQSLTTQSESHLSALLLPPMSESENLIEVMRWMATGYKNDYLDRSTGNLRLF